MPKISVIIPVYNVEKYLARCLDSVIAQTFSDIEIICINDGSTDNSAEILSEYAKKDKRIKIITQENSGVVAARNNGIASSVGEYIYPLDGDDIIAPMTLEKLYNAMVSGYGDVITSRVVCFGAESGEMILPKPNKLNFCIANCSVNAALFRKSDFELTGGYDTAYSVALEDYDLWLNFVYGHNKKFYRVPEKLFFYCIKDKSESRNWQHRSQHNDLVKSFYTKYPQMRLYKTIRKFLSPFKKIIRFFYRSNLDKTKIFKVLSFQNKKRYDYVISLGAACFVPDVLKNLNLRKFSGPFDWMYGSDVVCRLNIVLNSFQDYFNQSDLVYVGENPDNGKLIYKNLRTGIVYNHDFPHGNLSETYPDVAEKYTRRTNRVLKYMNSRCQILFVYSELAQTGNTKQICDIVNQINMRFPADIDLLYVNHNSQIGLNEHSEIKHITPNVIYSEYHYQKFPDELSAARHTLKNILRKVVK